MEFFLYRLGVEWIVGIWWWVGWRPRCWVWVHEDVERFWKLFVINVRKSVVNCFRLTCVVWGQPHGTHNRDEPVPHLSVSVVCDRSTQKHNLIPKKCDFSGDAFKPSISHTFNYIQPDVKMLLRGRVVVAYVLATCCIFISITNGQQLRNGHSKDAGKKIPKRPRKFSKFPCKHTILIKVCLWNRAFN